MKVAACVLAASVALGTGFMDAPLPLRLFVSSYGVRLVIVQCLHAACKYHENWVSARTTCEELNAEKALLVVGVGQILREDDREIVAVFCKRCEKIIQNEHERWIRLNLLAS